MLKRPNLSDRGFNHPNSQQSLGGFNPLEAIQSHGKAGKLRKSLTGFTIIEVLIVLAIAGLILLIVFLAVPALQRNSRNTQRKSDVARIAAIAQEVLTNNNLDMTKLDSATLRAQLGNLAYYTNTNVFVFATYQGGAPPPENLTDTTIAYLYKGFICANVASGGQGVTQTGATSRNMAVAYSIETSNGSIFACTSS